MSLSIKRSPNGWLFETRDLRAPGQQGGGGTSSTFCETEAQAKELLERFSKRYGIVSTT